LVCLKGSEAFDADALFTSALNCISHFLLICWPKPNEMCQVTKAQEDG